MQRSKVRRWLRLAAVYALATAAAALGWLWHSLPSEIMLEPGQALALPRFSWVEPLHQTGTRNAASTHLSDNLLTDNLFHSFDRYRLRSVLQAGSGFCKA